MRVSYVCVSMYAPYVADKVSPDGSTREI